MTASNDLGPVLLILARNAIGEHFGLAPAVTAGGSFPELGEPGACFVTLTRHGQLRGCIGSIEACRPLAADIAENARAAAFRDPRFAPLEFAEFAQIRLEVSLLSKPESFPASDENDACRQLQPHIDGVVLECRGHRATFLPQVWVDLPDPHDFLQHLKLKAGLPANLWSPDMHLQRYRVQKWKE